MAQSKSGGIVPPYGPAIRDKLKSADPETLRAYKIVAEDLLKDAAEGPDAQDLREALKELNQKLGRQGGTQTY